MLSLSQASFAFSAPALAPQMQPAAIAMKAPGEIGVTPPCVPALFFSPSFWPNCHSAASCACARVARLTGNRAAARAPPTAC